MRFPWTALRVSSLVAVAATAGYLWRGALDDPARISRVLPPEAFAQPSQPHVIFVPDLKPPRKVAKPDGRRRCERPSAGGRAVPALHRSRRR